MTKTKKKTSPRKNVEKARTCKRKRGHSRNLKSGKGTTLRMRSKQHRGGMTLKRAIELLSTKPKTYKTRSKRPKRRMTLKRAIELLSTKPKTYKGAISDTTRAPNTGW